MTGLFVSRWQKAVRDAPLSRQEKLTALVLSTYMDKDGKAWPGLRTLGKAASMDPRRAVARSLDALEILGFLEIERSQGGSTGNTNRYQARLPPPVSQHTA